MRSSGSPMLPQPEGVRKNSVSDYQGPSRWTQMSDVSSSCAIPRGERRAEAPPRREWIFQPLGFAFSPQARSGVESVCFSLDLIEVGLQICAGPLNHRERANWCATLFGELDQVVQVGAEFARGFDRTGNTHLALPSAPRFDQVAESRSCLWRPSRYRSPVMRDQLFRGAVAPKPRAVAW
jgi:hypothetical protein